MPLQPLSSRLSLAQGIVSANSKSKAVSLGLEAASNERWADGQPRVTVLGREIPVLRRYEDDEAKALAEEREGKAEASQETVKADTYDRSDPPLWALDVSSGDKHPKRNTMSGMPVHAPEAARSYLVRSFSTPSPPAATSISAEAPTKPKRQTAAALAAEREENAAMLLVALDALFESWANVLTREELDRRAWSWYVAVRPDVETGIKGWGEKGVVDLGKILKLKRENEGVIKQET